MKIDRGVIHDVFSDICIAVNKNIEYESEEHIAIHEAIRIAREKVYQHLNLRKSEENRK